MGSGFGLSAFDKKWDKYGVELSETASNQSKKWSKIYKLDLQKNLTINWLKNWVHLMLFFPTML